MGISFHDEELFGWIGNGIFILAQLIQIVYTYNRKQTGDISYGLSILWLIGNIMYTFFGYTDNSLSLFVGSAISGAASMTILSQKIYYECCKKNRISYERIGETDDNMVYLD